ncbi:hypothetical protein JCM18899A_19080 [Nocardioides sp. AN3]
MSTLRRLTVPEAAEIMRASERFILDEIRRKNLRASKMGKRWTISEAEVQRYVDAKANVSLVRGRS